LKTIRPFTKKEGGKGGDDALSLGSEENGSASLLLGKTMETIEERKGEGLHSNSREGAGKREGEGGGENW